MTAVAGADQLSLGASPQVGTTVAASLSADLAIAAATLTAVTSLSLGVGVWLVTGAATFTNGAANAAAIEASLAAGTATATFAWVQSAANEMAALSGGEQQVALTGCIVTVTVAGTIVLNAESPNACTAKAATSTYSLPNATGITAVQVA